MTVDCITETERNPQTFTAAPADMPTWKRCEECGAHVWLLHSQHIGGHGYQRKWMCPQCESGEIARYPDYQEMLDILAAYPDDRRAQWAVIQHVDAGLDVDAAIDAVEMAERECDERQMQRSLAHGF